jgi:DNA-binding NarL/FixJ family response regulator
MRVERLPSPKGTAPAHSSALRGSCHGWQELDAPYEAARARVLLGVACRSMDDHDSSHLELAAARQVFAELGAVTELAHIDSLIQRTSNAYGLTTRELEVLRLVAAGKSNRAIAEDLVISDHTVRRHLQNIFRKLGVSSRPAATAFAFQHDLT